MRIARVSCGHGYQCPYNPPRNQDRFAISTEAYLATTEHARILGWFQLRINPAFISFEYRARSMAKVHIADTSGSGFVTLETTT